MEAALDKSKEESTSLGHELGNLLWFYRRHHKPVYYSEPVSITRNQNAQNRQMHSEISLLLYLVRYLYSTYFPNSGAYFRPLVQSNTWVSLFYFTALLQDKLKKFESIITSQQVQIQNTEEMLSFNKVRTRINSRLAWSSLKMAEHNRIEK